MSTYEHVFPPKKGWKPIKKKKRPDHMAGFPICRISGSAITGLSRRVQRAATDIGFLPFSD